METRSSRVAKKVLAAVTLLMLQACGGNGDLFEDFALQLDYSVGGTVTGLAGSGLVLRNNGGDDLSLAANGSFTFATRLPKSVSYDVSVFAQPSNPSQTCVVAAGTGSWSGSPVTTVAVSCTTNTYTVGGTVSGLKGSGLVLRNNGGDDLSLAANGSFTFATRLPTGTSYDVTVFAQPSNPSQTCVVAAGTGTWSGSPVTTVAVSCTTNTYTVGGTVSGLKGSGLVLRNNGGDDLPVNDNGAFVFPGKLASGDSYDVTVSTQPTNPAQVCTTTDAVGAVGDSDIATVIVVCGSIARFVYSFSAGPALGSSHYISAYAIDASTGALSEVPGSPFVDGYRYGFRVTPNSRFAYAYSYENWIYGFAIDAVSGALSPVPGSAFPASTGSGQPPVVFDPSSRFVYAASGVDGNVYGYAIDAVTGALNPVPGSPFPAGAGPSRAVVDAKGQFLYVLNRGSGNVSAFSINPVSGTLTPLAGSPFVTESEPTDITFTPDGRLAYVQTALATNVSAYSVDGISGALTALAVIPFPDIHGLPRFTPNSRFAYWTSASEAQGGIYGGAKTVSGFAVDAANGVLTPVPGSQHEICCRQGDVVLHPSGKFLYVPSGYTIPGSSSIYGYAIDGTTGALQALDGSPFFCCGGRKFGLTIDASGRLGFEGVLDSVGFGYLESFVIDPVTGKPSGGDSVAVGWGGGGAVIAY